MKEFADKYLKDSPELQDMVYQGYIVDIKMRYLKWDELMRIQGFPEDYKLIGSQADKKKHIGNSVCPIIAQKIIDCLAMTNLKAA